MNTPYSSSSYTVQEKYSCDTCLSMALEVIGGTGYGTTCNRGAAASSNASSSLAEASITTNTE